MKKDVINVLEVELIEDLEGMNELELGDEAHTKACDATVKLLDRYNDIQATQVKIEEIKTRNRELDIREKELEAGKKDGLLKNVITVGTTLVTCGVWVAGLIVSYKNDKYSILPSDASREAQKKVFGVFSRK